MPTFIVTGASGRMGKVITAYLHCIGCETILVSRCKQMQNECDAVFPSLRQAFGQTRADAVIEFTSVQTSLENTALCVQNNTPIVIGTTGFDAGQIRVIHEYAEQLPIVLSYNMSLGVNVLCYLLQSVTKAVGDVSDIEIIESHHRNKIDAPSGTALMMGEVIAQELGLDLNESACFARAGQVGAREQKQIGFSAIRAGDIVGEHSALFALEGERIEISHKAGNRDIYAKGAHRAAQWLIGQSPGLYTMLDVLHLGEVH